MKISIVIPIYNVEKYIGKCIDSIFNQDIDDDKFEIIAVNDGTPDNSLSIVEKYRKDHDNIHILNQENRGLSFARNKGIDCANGDWILFVDPDDWIGKNTLNKLYEYLLKYDNLDIIILNSLFSDTKEKISDWGGVIEENECYEGATVFIKYDYIINSVCGTCFKRKFLTENEIYFPAGVQLGEDNVFGTKCQALTKKMQFFNLDFYYYFTKREGSLINTYMTPNTLENKFKTLDFYLKRLEAYRTVSQNLPRRNCALIERKRYSIYFHFTRTAISTGLSYKEIISKYEILSYLPIDTKYLPNAKKVQIQILNKSYRLFYLLMKIRMTK